MKYEYWTDAESMEFDANSDDEAVEFAKKESCITQAHIDDGAYLTVYDSVGFIVFDTERDDSIE